MKYLSFWISSGTLSEKHASLHRLLKQWNFFSSELLFIFSERIVNVAVYFMAIYHFILEVAEQLELSQCHPT